MQNRDVITGTAAAILSPFVENIESLVIWLMVSLVLIVTDLRFGLQAAHVRGERIRSSRAVRRTINKFVDYICWVMIAWTMGVSFGKVFDIPVLAALIMLVICLIEISSIFDNYFECHGMHLRFNTVRFIRSVFGKHGLDSPIEEEDGADDKKTVEKE